MDKTFNHKPVVIVQARLSSTRLPAKTMLNICGNSVLSLIGKRLSSDSYKLIFAVPEGSEGEILRNEINLLKNLNIETIAGSLNNVLYRFYTATEGLNPETIIVRMTSDNIFPDRHFVEELIEKYIEGYSYSKINNSAYGLCAEIFKKKHLNEAIKNSKTNYEFEHVTPYIRKHYHVASIMHNFKLKHDVRITMDTYQDYINIHSIFSQFDNAVTVSWKELLKKTYSLFPPQKKLMVGCVQFGMDYGIANISGQVKEEVVTKIITLANQSGVSNYDTASEYGNSENILGKNADILSNSQIITKLRKDVETLCDVKNSIYESCNNLRRSVLDGVLLHKIEHIGTPVWDYLKIFRNNGTVHRIGASVYDPAEAMKVLDDGNADIIQIPYNILDHRWGNFFEKASGKLKIHARSIFLQGVLINNNILNNMGYKDIGKILDQCVIKYNRKNRVDLCIAYVISQPSIDYVIMGVDNEDQFNENISYFNHNKLSSKEIKDINMMFKNIPESLLDVRLWS